MLHSYPLIMHFSPVYCIEMYNVYTTLKFGFIVYSTKQLAQCETVFCFYIKF